MDREKWICLITETLSQVTSLRALKIIYLHIKYVLEHENDFQ